MKCVGMQYLAAIRHFKKKQLTFKRTIHVMFVPEEELGGDGGMADFVHQEAFRNLNAGFSLDEGTNHVKCFYIMYLFVIILRNCFSHRCLQCLLR